MFRNWRGGTEFPLHELKNAENFRNKTLKRKRITGHKKAPKCM